MFWEKEVSERHSDSSLKSFHQKEARKKIIGGYVQWATALSIFGMALDFDESKEGFMRIVDLQESKKRIRYQIAELAVYLLPALTAAMITYVLSSSNVFLAIIVAAIVFFAPVIKLLVSKKIAPIVGKKNPKDVFRYSSFLYDGFMGKGSEPLREIRRFAALSRSLDVIYNFNNRFGVTPMKVLNHYPSNADAGERLTHRWAKFWINMPIAQDVRTRLALIETIYYWEIQQCIAQKKKIRVLEIAGGQLQAIISAIARVRGEGYDFQYEVTSVEPDTSFAKERALSLIKHHKLDLSCFRFIGSGVSTRDPKKNLKSLLSGESGFDVVCCIGLSDYYFSREKLKVILSQFNLGKRIIVANITNNRIERYFLHWLIQWPTMCYRSKEDWRTILGEVFVKSRSITIAQTPHGIFNIGIIEY